MKSIMKFKIRATHEEARKIADYIIIALVRYWTPNTTYVAEIRVPWIEKIMTEKTHDWCTCKRRIVIRKVYGNKGSILSPSQNEYFKKVIESDELLENLERFKNDET